MTGSVNALSSLRGNLPGKVQPEIKRSPAAFGELLKNAIQHTDGLQKKADQAVQELAGGNLDNLHDLMIVVEQAQLSLQLTVQVVTKVVQAYQEVYRMQI